MKLGGLFKLMKGINNLQKMKKGTILKNILKSLTREADQKVLLSSPSIR